MWFLLAFGSDLFSQAIKWGMILGVVGAFILFIVVMFDLDQTYEPPKKKGKGNGRWK